MNLDNHRPDAAIRCSRLVKKLGGITVLDGVTLEIPTGQVVGLLGPSGSGKSTLLRCLNWLLPPDSGEVWLGEERVGQYLDGRGSPRPLSERQIRHQRSRIGMVFQSFNLWPHLTALENVLQALVSVKHLPHAQAVEVASHALDEVGLGHRKHRYPAQLSGGQQQRVAIARTVAMQPSIILFDEPTSALDPELVGEVLNVIKALAARSTTMVIVTHEIAFAAEVCDRIVFMDEGRIVEQGTPQQVLLAPVQTRTRQFLNRFNAQPKEHE